MLRVVACVALLALPLPGQFIGIASVDVLGEGCGWQFPEFGGAPRFDFHPSTGVEGRVAISMHQPYSYDPSVPVERWIVVGDEIDPPEYLGCPVFLNRWTANYWRFPDISTWALFMLPPDHPALHGTSVVLQGFVRLGQRVDISRGIRVTWGAGS